MLIKSTESKMEKGKGQEYKFKGEVKMAYKISFSITSNQKIGL